MRRAGADDGGEDAVGSGDSGGELAVERAGTVDVDAFAVLGAEQAAVLRVVAGVVCFGEGLIAVVSGGHEGVAALLDPLVEVGGRVLRGQVSRPLHNPRA